MHVDECTTLHLTINTLRPGIAHYAIECHLCKWYFIALMRLSSTPILLNEKIYILESTSKNSSLWIYGEGLYTCIFYSGVVNIFTGVVSYTRSSAIIIFELSRESRRCVESQNDVVVCNTRNSFLYTETEISSCCVYGRGVGLECG